MAKPRYCGAIIAHCWGRYGKTVFAQVKGGVDIARTVYQDRKRTTAQNVWAVYYNAVDDTFDTLTATEKAEWRKVAHGKGQSYYAAFMSVNLKRLRVHEPIIRVP